MASLGCPNCADWPDAREGLSKYDGYCATCFKYNFPDDDRSTEINPGSREQRVRDAIIAHFRDKGFIFNRPLHTKGGGCDCPSRRRIDNYVFLNGTILAVEVDEEAHQHYNQTDEKNRYDELLTDYGGKMVYIRFNPDPTSDDRSDLEDRLRPLMTEIEKQMGRIQREENQEIVEIIYMYYPENKDDKKQGGVVSIDCEFCHNQFSSKSSLRLHQKTAKFCLQIQGKKSADIATTCPYCSKELANRSYLPVHITTCPEKVKSDYEAKIAEYAQKCQDSKNELTTQKQECEFKLAFQQQQFEARLSIQKQEYEAKFDQMYKTMANLAAQRTVKSVVNNHTHSSINIAAPVDLSVENVKKVIDRHLTLQVIGDGQVGVANMLHDNLLTNDKGDLLYQCTDVNRGHFLHLDKTGQPVRDVKASRLKAALVEAKVGQKAIETVQANIPADDERFSHYEVKAMDILSLHANQDAKFRGQLAAVCVSSSSVAESTDSVATSDMDEDEDE